MAAGCNAGAAAALLLLAALLLAAQAAAVQQQGDEDDVNELPAPGGGLVRFHGASPSFDVASAGNASFVSVRLGKIYEASPSGQAVNGRRIMSLAAASPTYSQGALAAGARVNARCGGVNAVTPQAAAPAPPCCRQLHHAGRPEHDVRVDAAAAVGPGTRLCRVRWRCACWLCQRLNRRVPGLRGAARLLWLHSGCDLSVWRQQHRHGRCKLHQVQRRGGELVRAHACRRLQLRRRVYVSVCRCLRGCTTPTPVCCVGPSVTRPAALWWSCTSKRAPRTARTQRTSTRTAATTQQVRAFGNQQAQSM